MAILMSPQNYMDQIYTRPVYNDFADLYIFVKIRVILMYDRVAITQINYSFPEQ